MKTNSVIKLLCYCLLPAALCLPAWAQGSAFTYQGRLDLNGAPAHGTYDFQFTVRDALTSGAAVGANPLAATLAVSNGLFTATLDPGPGVFTGADRWLEIAVKTNGAALFTTLSPRQKITAAPYAIYSGGVTASGISGTIAPANIGAESITTAMLAPGAVGANQLAAGAVTTAALADGAVTAPKMATVTNWYALMITNPTPAVSDKFGYAVAAVGSDRMLIGAHGDGTGATNAGAAYLVSLNGALLTTFTNPTPAAFDFFGVSVASMSSDRVLIGAYGNGTGANNVGAAYLFSSNGAWLTTFTNPTPAALDYFGNTVAAVGSDRVLIGAYGDDTGAAQAGAAYLFRTNGALLTTFTNPTPAVNDNFGFTVAAVGGDRVLIGAYGDNRGGTYAGAAYLFGTNGALLTTFTNPAPAAFESFGVAVAAVGSDRVLLGAHGHSTSVTNIGAAYLFRTNGTLLTTFTNPTPAAFDYFGRSVTAVGSDRVLIGAYGDGTGATNAGAAYLFRTDGTLLTTFTNPTPAVGDVFGFAVTAVGSDRVLIGAHGDDPGATDAGAAYLFSVETFTPGLVADGVRHGSVTTASLADGAVTAAKIGGVLLPSQIPDLDASKITSGTVPAAALSNAWRIGGNNVAPGQFIGTTNNQPLELKVNGQRGLRLEPTAVPDAVNVIGGSARNVVGAGVVGATIGGGGAGVYLGVASSNRVEADFGTVSGGERNTIQLGAWDATIGGGLGNTLQPNAQYSTIGGGVENTIQATAQYATIGGGGGNTIQPNATFATIPGGRNNSATNYAFAAGHRAKANHTGAFVWADSQNADFASTGTNQFLIRATGNVGINKANPTTVLDVLGTVTATGFSGNGAGLTNLTAGSLTGSVPGAALTSVPAGNLTGTVPATALSNAWRIGGNDVAPGQFIGTTNNQALDFKVSNQRGLRLEPGGSNSVNVIGGWIGNGVAPGVAGATIGGGGAGDYFGGAYTNRVEADFSTVSGGRQNTIQPNAYSATIPGGQNNTIESNAYAATIGGGDLNTIQAGTAYATISGGFQNTVQTSARLATIGGGTGNTAAGGWSTISGGTLNTIQTNAQFASIGGGFFNTIQTDAARATIGGGTGNTIETMASHGTIGGGTGNTIQTNATYATIGGGYLNLVTNHYATVPGGAGNTAGGQFSFAAGHNAKALHNGAFVWADSPGGGFASTGNDQFLIRAAGGVAIGTNDPAGAALRVAGTIKADAFLGMGTTFTLGTTDTNALEFKVNGVRALRLEPTAFTDTVNVIGGSARNSVGAGVVGATIGGGGAGDYFGGAYTNRVEADFSTVSGGRQNTIQSNAYSATIGGGENNTIQIDANRATIGGGGGNTIHTNAYSATIGGGYNNTIQTGASRAFIGGGENNTIQTSALWATIGGGRNNTIHSNPYFATIGGGQGNRSGGDHATVGGGQQNTASNFFATVSGGQNNMSSGEAATVPGGRENLAAGILSFAAGFRAKANHVGAFVWADASIAADLDSTAAHQCSIRASGGYRLFSNSGATAGVSLAPGGTAWGIISDRNVKKDLAPVDQRAILEKLAALPITQWHYQWESPDVTPHIGPMAQDFKAAFYPGTDDKTITTQEADGVALAAIQGLNQKVEGEVTALRAENAELKRRLEKLERLMNGKHGGTR